MNGWASFRTIMFLLVLTSAAMASNTWYVDGVNGNDTNDCRTPQTACKTIGHAISLASSGDSVMVAPATYTENLTINISLKIIGSGATTTIIDGGGVGTVIVNRGTGVTLSKVTIRNGSDAGITNAGTLTLNNSIVSGNSAVGFGGGIKNSMGATLTINNSTISHNFAGSQKVEGSGGGIGNSGVLIINNGTLDDNDAGGGQRGVGRGGGIQNQGTAAINNSTISANVGDIGGGIFNGGTGCGGRLPCKMKISNSTISGNTLGFQGPGGGVYNSGTVIFQNSILANNSHYNCVLKMTSKGYNLSSDGSCSFNGSGDMNNTDPKLGTLGNYGGPTQTIPLLEGSPAIDAGNPNGCTDGSGKLLKTDQRGKPRPDKEDETGCDMGAFEKQSD